MEVNIALKISHFNWKVQISQEDGLLHSNVIVVAVIDALFLMVLGSRGVAGWKLAVILAWCALFRDLMCIEILAIFPEIWEYQINVEWLHGWGLGQRLEIIKSYVYIFAIDFFNFFNMDAFSIGD